jgi:thiol-disulfide isomerase/thioredoxin
MSPAWTAAYVVLAAVVLVLAFVQMGSMRRMLPMLDRLEEEFLSDQQLKLDILGARAGEVVPDFDLTTLSGEPISFQELLRTPSLVLFFTAGCGPCEALSPQLPAALNRLGPVGLYVIVEDTEEGRNVWVPPGISVLYQVERAASSAFRNVATPQAFAVDDERVVRGRRLITSIDDLEDLGQDLQRRWVSAQS